MWWTKITQIFKIKDLRRNILFVLLLLGVFRLAAHIPIPGINAENLRAFFASNQILGLVNMFSGGGMENFSIVAMGVAPYITASIIFQLLTMIVPALEELSKEPNGHERINRYTRWLAIPLAMLQGYGMISLLRQSQMNILGDLTGYGILSIMITVTAGTIFLMWLGELISEKNIGNGISLLIFAGIVTAIPGVIQRTILSFDASKIFGLVVFAIIALITIVGVVVITEGQRNVPVSYAKRVRGNKMYGGVNTHLPLRVNQAGVIPIIFAISLVLFPSLIAQFFLQAQSSWLRVASEWVISLFQNQFFYGIIYFVLVVGFTYFYTAVIFHPDQIAENLQKQGGFIPGIRPGRHTADYLGAVMTRIILAGSLFLGAIAVLPLAVQKFTGLTSMVIGGTSLLIVVSVVIETVKQIDSQLTMRDYDGF